MVVEPTEFMLWVMMMYTRDSQNQPCSMVVVPCLRSHLVPQHCHLPGM
jgi:hypothetical protein